MKFDMIQLVTLLSRSLVLFFLVLFTAVNVLYVGVFWFWWLIIQMYDVAVVPIVKRSPRGYFISSQ